ncbi:hypothetical protein [Sphingobacterium sp.]|uniref:hypothetical protein n=1 Tax=Sphingobacterium sp. TaxID=341027 RepID=UPI0028A87AC0|nr:hypothetical protein [Sphingobacterium sp.]
MLEKVSWTQILLPLSITLIIYYSWVLSSLYGKRLIKLMNPEDGPSSFEKESYQTLRAPLKQESAREDGPKGTEEFLEQLRLYLEPYRNAELDLAEQWPILREVMAKYNPSGDSVRDKELMRSLFTELHRFGVQVPESIFQERIGKS